MFVGALAVGATGAFFSDTETSTGNTFAAGDIDLQIDNESYVTSTTTGSLVFSPSTSWLQQNLGQGCQTLNASSSPCLFFHFSDVKPGDIGEDTISVHVGSNSAWACIALNLTAKPENTIVDPEIDAGDSTTTNATVGELQNYLHFTFWKDDGDNVFEDGEPIIPSLNNVLASTTFDGRWHTLADASTSAPLVGNSTNYIAKAWCFGNLLASSTPQDLVGHTGTGTGNSTNGPLIRGTGFTCDGSGPNNDAQTDGISLDVSFQAIQSRNNGKFLCKNLPPLGNQQPPTPTTGTLTVTKVVANTNPGNGFIASTTLAVGDFPLFLDSLGITSGVATTTSASVHVVTETGNLDFDAVFGGNCDAAGNVTVPPGGAASCTITNTFDGISDGI